MKVSKKIFVIVVAASMVMLACKKKTTIEPVKESEPLHTEITRGVSNPKQANGFILTSWLNHPAYYGSIYKQQHLNFFSTFSDIPMNLTGGYDRWINEFQSESVIADLSVGELKLNGQKIYGTELTGPRYYYLNTNILAQNEIPEISVSYAGNQSWSKNAFQFQNPFPEVKSADSIRISKNDIVSFNLDDIFSDYDSAYVYLVHSHYRSGETAHSKTAYTYQGQKVNYMYDELIIEQVSLVGIYFHAIKYFYKWENGKLLRFEFERRCRMQVHVNYQE